MILTNKIKNLLNLSVKLIIYIIIKNIYNKLNYLERKNHFKNCEFI